MAKMRRNSVGCRACMRLAIVVAFLGLAIQARADIPYRDDAYFESQRRTDVDERLASLLVEREKRAHQYASDTTGPAARLEHRKRWERLHAERFDHDDALYILGQAQRYISGNEGIDWERLSLALKCTSLGLYLPETGAIAQQVLDQIREEGLRDCPSDVVECARQALFVLAMSPNAKHWKTLSDATTSSFWDIKDMEEDASADCRQLLREAAIVGIAGMPLDRGRPLMEQVVEGLGGPYNPNEQRTQRERNSQTGEEKLGRMASDYVAAMVETETYRKSIESGDSSK